MINIVWLKNLADFVNCGILIMYSKNYLFRELLFSEINGDNVQRLIVEFENEIFLINFKVL